MAPDWGPDAWQVLLKNIFTVYIIEIVYCNNWSLCIITNATFVSSNALNPCAITDTLHWRGCLEQLLCKYVGKVSLHQGRFLSSVGSSFSQNIFLLNILFVGLVHCMILLKHKSWKLLTAEQIWWTLLYFLWASLFKDNSKETSIIEEFSCSTAV